MSSTINVALQSSVRKSVKTEYKNIAIGREKTGKDVVRAGHQKLLEKSLRRHAAVTSQFLAHEGKGGVVDMGV